MIDLHCHVLPGIDDGPRTFEESLAMGRAAEASGTRVIVATPHVSSTYPNDAATIERLVDELNERFAANGIDVEVRCGAEIAITRFIDIAPDELPRLALAASGWLLLEPPFGSAGAGLEWMLLTLRRQGHRIVLAHPERCAAFQRNPRMLESLVREGVLVSITAGALVGSFGDGVRRFALGLVAAGLVHNVASDAHNVDRRPPGILDPLSAAGLTPLARWLTEEVPQALLLGEDAPPRPAFSVSVEGEHASRTRLGR